MKITRDNYESFFIRLLDGELDAAGQKSVMDFLEVHDDLRSQWEALQLTKLEADPSVVFPDKQLLYRSEQAFNNAESDFILYLDQELSPQEKIRVATLLKSHPGLQPQFDTLMQVRFHPDPAIRFEPKSLLYRTEKKRAPLPFTWQRWAAAALVMITAGLCTVIFRNMATENAGTPIVKTPSPLPALMDDRTPDPAGQPSVVAGIHRKKSIPQSMLPSPQVAAQPVSEPQSESAPARMISGTSPEISETIVANTQVIGAESFTLIPPPSVLTEPSPPATETEPVKAGSVQNSDSPESAVAPSNLIQWTRYVSAENTMLEKKIDRKVRFRTALRQVSRVFETATERPVNGSEGRHVQIAFFNIALENE